MKHKILLLESQKIIIDTVTKMLVNFDVVTASSAAEALVLANDNDFVAVITELTLAGHSGFEFLYEFRSYEDWRYVPIIVYTTIKLNNEVLKSRSWTALSIHDYIYKPSASLASLKDSLEKALVQG